MSALLAPNPTHATIGNAMSEGFRAPSKVGICEWAEREIRIIKGPDKGRFRVARAPYMRRIFEAFTDPRVRDLTLKTATQVGKTTIETICAAFAISEDPEDILIVLPKEDAARELSNERIQPMFSKSPGIRAQLTERLHDQQTERLVFLRCTVYFGWANSPASLASRTVRFLFLDETGKYGLLSKKEADPVKLATERTKNFPYTKKIFAASSPTTPEAVISRRYEQSNKCRYWVPCPHCGEMQLLVTAYVKWPQGARSDDVKDGNLAWYECCKCGARLTDQDKPRMLAGGEWRAENPNVRTHEGFQINSLYSPWVPLSHYAAEYLATHSFAPEFMNFVNGWEGGDWLEKAAEVTDASIAALKIKYTMGIIPFAAQLLTCGIDVMDAFVRYVVRAWGPNEESWLVDCGTFLAEKDENGYWKQDKTYGVGVDLAKIATELIPTQYEHANGSRMPIHFGYIDSGYRAAEVYKLTSRLRHVLEACKGANEEQVDGEDAGKLNPRWRKEVEKHRGLYYTRLNTTFYKDMWNGFRESGQRPWHIPEGVDAQYLAEIASEHKQIKRRANGQGVHAWVKKTDSAPNHYLDCEVYALAAADQKGFRKLVAPEHAPRGPVKRAPVRMPDGRPFFVGNR